MSMRTLPTLLLATGLALAMDSAVAQSQASKPAEYGQAAAASTEVVQRPDGATIHYEVSGQGTPMLLIHGYPLSGELFAKNREALSKQFKVITLDQRGFGQSKTPNSEASVKTYAEDAFAVMDALKIDKAIIGGMSMGGPVALEMYRQSPERFKGMMLIDTTANPAIPPEAGLWNGMATLVQDKGVSALPPVLLKDMLTGETRLAKKPVVSTLEGIIKQASKEAAIAGAHVLANRPDSRPTLPTIKVPTLIIVGVADTIYPPAMATAMKEAIPNATLKMIDGAAHAAVIEKPDQVNQSILDWAKATKW